MIKVVQKHMYMHIYIRERVAGGGRWRKRGSRKWGSNGGGESGVQMSITEYLSITE